MSTAPSGFQTPKTNWQTADVVQPSDLNRIEGNINAIEQGARTLNQAQAPSGNAGSLRQILSWLANRIRAITGTTNWYDAPPTTLTATKAHIDATGTSAHGGLVAAIGNTIAVRDAQGRLKAAAPVAADDVVRKAELDANAIPVENLLRDQYSLHSELYYLGYHGGPTIDGLKGMMWDGFIDTSRVNTNITNVQVDTYNNQVIGNRILPVSASSSGGTKQFVNLEKAFDNNRNTYAKAEVTATSLTCYLTIRFPFPVSLRGIDVRVDGRQSHLVNDQELSTVRVYTGSGWTTVLSSPVTISSGSNIKPRWSPVNGVTQLEMKFYSTPQYDNTELHFLVREVVGVLAEMGRFQTEVTNLPYDVRKVVAVISASDPSHYIPMISVDGTNWYSMTQGDSRQDPMFEEFIETEYTAVIQNPGSSLILRCDFPENPEILPILKRYGMYWL